MVFRLGVSFCFALGGDHTAFFEVGGVLGSGAKITTYCLGWGVLGFEGRTRAWGAGKRRALSVANFLSGRSQCCPGAEFCAPIVCGGF